MPTSPKHYFCEPCQVFGQGKACWCCGTPVDELVTEGPVVDAHVYDGPGSAHVYRDEGEGAVHLTADQVDPPRLDSSIADSDTAVKYPVGPYSQKPAASLTTSVDRASPLQVS